MISAQRAGLHRLNAHGFLTNRAGEAKVQAALFTFMDFCAIMELLDRLEFDEVLE